MNAISKLKKRINKVKSLLCVGLDSDFAKLPARFRKLKHSQFEFNKWIIDQTHEFVCAYKPNSAFYEARGAEGIAELKLTCDYLREEYSDIPIILDFKRGDIGNTNRGYADYAFKYLQVDAVTLQPYQGIEALEPFFKFKDKGLIILCKTSNPGSGELQDMEIDGEPVWQLVAKRVAGEWNKHGNCMLVVGATYPEQLKEVRQIVGEMFMLVPGVGAQGGDLAEVLKVGLNKDKSGLIINSSRGIIFADNPRQEAEKVVRQMKIYL